MTEPKRYQCRHIFTDGHRCGSPCLRAEDFCYYHHTTRRPVLDPRQRRANQAHFDLPMPEDRAAIQLSIGEILRRIARNEIDPRRAGLLLYRLQIASTNLPRQTSKPTRNTRDEAAPQPIEEITTDPEQGLLAPQSEFTQPERPRSIMRQILDQFAQEKPTPEPQPTDRESAILPELQATAENPATPSAQIGIKPFRLQSAFIRTNPRLHSRVRPLQSGRKCETVKSTYGNLAYRRDLLRADIRLRWNAGGQCSRRIFARCRRR